jgi:GTP-binding protein
VIKILDARFLTTSVSPESYPEASIPEIAFVGRSNVGKSSMINALAGRRKLVRVSKTPGRTRTINFFDLDLEWEGKRQRVRIADLPGYGFARVGKAERARWNQMITTYLEQRASLSVVVSIVDAEVGPTANDQQMLDYLSSLPPRVLVVATKSDRISKARRNLNWKQIAKALGLPSDRVVLFSAVEGIGVQEVWETLLSAIDSRTGVKPDSDKDLLRRS